jgi:ribosomal protein S27AE
MEKETMCACGRPLHYNDKIVQEMTQLLVNELGENVRVSFGERTWIVQRHFIALHGINRKLCLEYGFPEVDKDTELGIICPRCGMTSFNPNDVETEYCGNCHLFRSQMEQQGDKHNG